MSALSDRDYFARRAVAEIALGEGSCDARVAAVHFDLALRYSSLCRELALRTAKVIVLDDERRARRLNSRRARRDDACAQSTATRD